MVCHKVGGYRDECLCISVCMVLIQIILHHSFMSVPLFLYRDLALDCESSPSPSLLC